MRRFFVLVCACAFGVIALCGAASGAPRASGISSSQTPAATRAKNAGRVVMLTIDGTSLADWRAHAGPQLREILANGSVALMSSRTTLPFPKTHSDCTRRTKAAANTMVSGERVDDRASFNPSPLRAVLNHNNLEYRDAALNILDSSVPGGLRSATDLLAEEFGGTTSGLTVLETVESMPADCLTAPVERDGWIERALTTADATLSELRRFLTLNDTLIVVSRVPTFARERMRDFLTPIVIVGPRFGPGSLTSPSTRRPGLITLVDLAPTVVRILKANGGIGIGRPGVPIARRDIYDDDAAYVHVSQSRLGILKTYVYASGSLIALAALLVIAGRGRARAGRSIASGRDALAFGLSLIAAAPLAMVLEPAFHVHSPHVTALIIAGVTVLIALTARIALGPSRAMGLIAATTLIVVAGDLVAGAPLSSRSVVSYTMGEGARFYGIGNELMGVLIISTLLWASSVLDAGARVAAPLTALCLCLVVLMSAPPIGAKFGSTLVAVPAFGVLLARAWGHRLHARTGLAIAIATTFIASVTVAVDLSLGEGSRSHIARVASGHSSGVLARKIQAAVGLLAGSYWTHGLAIALIVTILIAWKRPVLVLRGTWGRPHLRSAMIAGGVGSVGAILFNDAGIIAAGMIVMIGSAAFFTLLLVGQATPPPASKRLERLKEFAR
ncbi:MAG: hypothetical protein NVSMB57_03410 [Actinomycetota bacterium]